MLLHVSFAVRDPERVARALAELLGATALAAPSPPFPAGARLVCRFDDRGSLIEVLPAGHAYVRGPGDLPHLERAGDAAPGNGPSAVHALCATPLDEDAVRRVAEREGWPCARVEAGPFQVLAVWVEGVQLVELVTPERLADYVAFYGAAARATLDARLREVEAHLRARAQGARA